MGLCYVFNASRRFYQMYFGRLKCILEKNKTGTKFFTPNRETKVEKKINFIF